MLLSHIYEDSAKKDKLLVDHLSNVTNLCLKSFERLNVNFTIISKEDFKKLILIAALFHDFGKATTFFQDHLEGRRSDRFTHHSEVSAIIAFFVAQNAGFENRWAYMVYQVIIRHHGDLKDFEKISIDNQSVLKKQIINIASSNDYIQLVNFYSTNNFCISEIVTDFNFRLEGFRDFVDDIDEFVEDLSSSPDYYEYFFLNNFLFSLLIDSDKSDAAELTNEYFANNLQEKIYDIEGFLSKMREKNKDKFDTNNLINKVRTEFLESIKYSKQITSNKHIYSITAPTGIGKTFGCMLFAERLKDILREDKNIEARIIYALPYTSIIDQNYIEFEKVIKSSMLEKYSERPTRYLLKHHYLSPLKVENRVTEEEKYQDYLNDKLFVESWQASIVITTYVQILHSIFGYKNSFLKKIHNIANSIIILDEVQNINPQYHYLIGNALEKFAEIFNVYFLQLTATQPNIFKPEINNHIVSTKMFMQNNIFNRVTIDFKRELNDIDKFVDYFDNEFNDINCLVVVNTKKIATSLYALIKALKGDYRCYCLTTNLTPKDRNYRIEEIKSNLSHDKKIIVISTQLIEAGVDLSFKRVYRDFAPLDSIVQVSGRCNRHCEYGTRNGKMIIFNTVNNSVYPKILLQFTREVLENKDFFEDKDFMNLTKQYFDKFDFSATSDEIITAIKFMNYDTKGVSEQISISEFKVIDEYLQYNVFALHTEEAQSFFIKLMNYKELLANENDKSKKDDLLLSIEKLKYEIIPYRISLSNKLYETYKDLIKPDYNEDKHYYYQYLNFEDCINYAYDNEIGILNEPKKAIVAIF